VKTFAISMRHLFPINEFASAIFSFLPGAPDDADVDGPVEAGALTDADVDALAAAGALTAADVDAPLAAAGVLVPLDEQAVASTATIPNARTRHLAIHVPPSRIGRAPVHLTFCPAQHRALRQEASICTFGLVPDCYLQLDSRPDI
jgi:hypothetical protein